MNVNNGSLQITNFHQLEVEGRKIINNAKLQIPYLRRRTWGYERIDWDLYVQILLEMNMGIILTNNLLNVAGIGEKQNQKQTKVMLNSKITGWKTQKEPSNIKSTSNILVRWKEILMAKSNNFKEVYRPGTFSKSEGNNDESKILMYEKPLEGKTNHQSMIDPEIRELIPLDSTDTKSEFVKTKERGLPTKTLQEHGCIFKEKQQYRLMSTVKQEQRSNLRASNEESKISLHFRIRFVSFLNYCTFPFIFVFVLDNTKSPCYVICFS